MVAVVAGVEVEVDVVVAEVEVVMMPTLIVGMRAMMSVRLTCGSGVVSWRPLRRSPAFLAPHPPRRPHPWPSPCPCRPPLRRALRL